MTTPRRYENAKIDDVPVKIIEMLGKINDKGIYIHGQIGSGKTHIAYAIKNGLKGVGQIVVWNIVDLIQEIKKDFDRPQYDKRFIEEEINNPDNKLLLILDDIGVERVSGFVLETLYRIINYRYVNML